MVVRDAVNALVVNQVVGVRFSVLQGSSSGLAVYVETHSAITNENGLASLEIGGGSAVTGSLASINWANGPFFIKSEVDPAGGTNYTINGTTQLLSVPYAMYAASSGSSIPGPQGPAGNDGAPGVAGPQGQQGPTGPQGPAGVNGQNGLSAYQVWLSLGNTGSESDFISSLSGPQGVAGPIGPQGPTGATGAQGPAGNDGATGPQGPTGPQGTTGAQGPAGPQGATGAQGPAGNDGAAGQQGPTGPQGATGAQGPAGPQGATGAAGPQGPTGPQGATGPQGPAGSNGINGAEGKTLLNGINNPSAVLGNNGDFYINTTTNTLFGPKTSGVWPATGVSLVGPQGNGYSNGTANNQIMYWNGTAWVTLNPGNEGQTLTICNNALTWTVGGQCPGTITSLNCSAATNTGILVAGNNASGVSSMVPYTGGNGGPFSGQSLASTGVTGLTATLASGYFGIGAGNLTYSISGVPSSTGTASFNIHVGGQSCVLNLNIVTLTEAYPTGSVFCNGPTTIVEVSNPSTGKVWMDRNLGANQVATNFNDFNASGDLYQWGRRSDGHQCRNSSITGTLSSSNQPSHGSFIATGSQPYDWRQTPNANLWQGVNGINNPCPTGYRLPTSSEFNAETLTWSSANFTGAFASPLKLVLTGGRDYNTASTTQITGGWYWTSTVILGQSDALSFSSFAPTIQANYRGYGFSVRCIKD